MATASPVSDGILTRATLAGATSVPGLPALLGFRFAFVYLILYGLRRAVEPLPYGRWLLDQIVDFARAPVVWFADVVLGVRITAFPAGSGDTTYNYVHVLVLAVVAISAAVLWTALVGRRHPALLRDRLHMYLRFVLGATMIWYGAIKVVPAQFPAIQPSRLDMPLGEMSPMGLLWTFMGYSPAYGAFTGALEIVGGLLLFWRRTTTLGAAMSAAVLLNVLALNLCFDVPVKLFSFHLLMISVVLVLPDAGRLLDVLVLHRSTAPVATRAPFRSRWLERTRRPIKVLLVVCVLGTAGTRAHESWIRRGGGEPRPGIGHYEVHTFLRGGVVQARTLDDVSQWRSFAVSPLGYAVIRTMQGPGRGYGMLRIPLANVMLLVRVRDDQVSYGWLRYRREGDGLIIQGLFDAVPLEARMRRNDGSSTELMSRGFHWISESHHNR
jgi:hypothetical protein